VVSEVGELWLGLEVRRKIVLVKPIAMGRRAILVIVLLVIGATVEIGWALVFVWPAVICVACD